MRVDECESGFLLLGAGERAQEVGRLEGGVAVDAAVSLVWEHGFGDERRRSVAASAWVPQREAKVLLAVRAEQVVGEALVGALGEGGGEAHRVANRWRMWAMYARAVRSV
jgi:hypothetical protein